MTACGYGNDVSTGPAGFPVTLHGVMSVELQFLKFKTFRKTTSSHWIYCKHWLSVDRIWSNITIRSNLVSLRVNRASPAACDNIRRNDFRALLLSPTLSKNPPTWNHVVTCPWKVEILFLRIMIFIPPLPVAVQSDYSCKSSRILGPGHVSYSSNFRPGVFFFS